MNTNKILGKILLNENIHKQNVRSLQQRAKLGKWVVYDSYESREDAEEQFTNMRDTNLSSLDAKIRKEGRYYVLYIKKKFGKIHSFD